MVLDPGTPTIPRVESEFRVACPIDCPRSDVSSRREDRRAALACLLTLAFRSFFDPHAAMLRCCTPGRVEVPLLRCCAATAPLFLCPVRLMKWMPARQLCEERVWRFRALASSLPLLPFFTSLTS